MAQLIVQSQTVPPRAMSMGTCRSAGIGGICFGLIVAASSEARLDVLFLMSLVLSSSKWDFHGVPLWHYLSGVAVRSDCSQRWYSTSHGDRGRAPACPPVPVRNCLSLEQCSRADSNRECLPLQFAPADRTGAAGYMNQLLLCACWQQSVGICRNCAEPCTPEDVVY